MLKNADHTCFSQEQYIFIHDTLMEAVLATETEVPMWQLPAYVGGLLTPDMSYRSQMERQFKVTTLIYTHTRKLLKLKNAKS